jgi:transposase
MTVTDKLLTIRLVATAASSLCPLCAQAATHVRSYYTRLVADVPCAGRHVQLIVRVRKFRCDTLSCPRKV